VAKVGFDRLESDCCCEAIIQYDIDWRSLGARSMKVRRIISNVATSDVEKASAFYHDVLSLELIMDLGWIRTCGSSAEMTIQVSVASEGGSGTDVPDMSIEVDDLEEALRRVQKAGFPIEYGPKSEPWGVRRIYVRDPFGKLINILQHQVSGTQKSTSTLGGSDY
jgi:catechol 2,3-dioxygenase-like lactoylglutathione lyase family enzyme